MNCRINITGRKTWNDGNNAHHSRPAQVKINLLRGGEIHDSVTLDTSGYGMYRFECLPVWDGAGKRFEYRIDEDAVSGYTRTVQGNNITNTLNEITVTGSKIWNDNHGAGATRPGTVTINLLQNGQQFRPLVLTIPAGQDTVPFSFPNVPFADAAGKPYVYTVDEAPIAGYVKAIDGFNITNTPGTYAV